MKEGKNLQKEDIKQLIAIRNDNQLKKYLEDTHHADLAEIIKELDNNEDRQYLLEQLDNEVAALVLNELNPEFVAELLEQISKDKVSEIFVEMPFDDAADFLGELSDNEKEKFLKLFEVHDAQDVQELMDYAADTAGGIMTTEYVAIPENITAGKAIEVLREIAPDAETVYYVYVINLQNQLVGVISLRELIIANPQAVISEIMRRKVISVNVKDDQEDVA